MNIGTVDRDQASRLNLGTFDLNLLVVFETIMQERNLTRAGRRLGLTQPAVSHALSRLRQLLKDELFIRTPEGMKPTPRAVQMGAPVREALRVLQLTLEPDQFDPLQSSRTFTLSVNNYAARAVVPLLAGKLKELAPNVGLDARPTGTVDVLEQLDSGVVHLALTSLVASGERFKCAAVMQDEFAVLLSGDHPAATADSLGLEQFASIPHLVITSSGDDTQFIDEALEERGLARRIAARVPFLSIVLMLLRSDCLAVVPLRVAVGLAEICPLVLKPLPFPSPLIGLWMIWHKRLDSHAAQRWLREAIRASVASE
jgi:DNA-binding transcriptional LysR family regulator